MKILVTGHRGYIGPHLVKLLQAAGHFVTGVDIGYFDSCHWKALPRADKKFQADFRSLTERDLKGHDCICKHSGLWACMDTQRNRGHLTRLVEADAPPWLA